MKEVIAIAKIGPCEMSGPSPKFFDVCSKFSDVPLFRPTLFIKDDSRARWGPFHRQASQEVLCHGNVPL